MKHHRMDDLRTDVTLSNIVCANGVEMPSPGSTIIFTGREQCGIEFDADHRGYAIIHTARPMTRPSEPKEMIVTTVAPTNLLGWKGIEITAKYTLPTKGFSI